MAGKDSLIILVALSMLLMGSFIMPQQQTTAAIRVSAPINFAQAEQYLRKAEAGQALRGTQFF